MEKPKDDDVTITREYLASRPPHFAFVALLSFWGGWQLTEVSCEPRRLGGYRAVMRWEWGNPWAVVFAEGKAVPFKLYRSLRWSALLQLAWFCLRAPRCVFSKVE